jgi:hypothetical protein
VASAQHLGTPTDDLDKRSVEELFTLQVTSGGREAQQSVQGPRRRICSDRGGYPTLRSQFDLSRHWRLDLMARARSRDTVFALPGTLLMDARLAWLPTKSGEFSLAVRDLTGRHVLETNSEEPFAAIPTERTFVIRWSQRF